MNATDHPIPPIIHKRGHLWKQPDREEIEVDASTAVMTQATLDALRMSQDEPSAAYQGKMWRRFEGGPPPRWLLCWFGPLNRHGRFPVETREVFVV